MWKLTWRMTISHAYQEGESEATYLTWASCIDDVNRIMLTLPTFDILLSKILGSSANSAEGFTVRNRTSCQEQDSSKTRGAKSDKSEALVKHATLKADIGDVFRNLVI